MKVLVISLVVALFSAPVLADPPSFSAQVDRETVSLDDSVSLKISITTDGSERLTPPEFNAPDFAVVNEYNSTFVESYYNNGKFGMRNNQTITKVLKPMRQGNLKISGIQVRIAGKLYSAPDIPVQVSSGGMGTPPPRGYGGSNVGLRGAGKRSTALPVTVRAEISREKAYKGEQVVVSYYLYRRVRVFNIQVDKFPTLNGFLREDLEMPVLGQRLDSERVVMDGVPYERSLLVRYAVYPLQEGKLKIDPIGLKYNYYAPTPGMGDEDDPFMNFFQQMAPRSSSGESQSLTVEVIPLPEDGRPNSFSGGVGDFNLTSAVDKYDVRANEAVTLTIKVEGRGNVAAISEPKAKWPESVELYDSKGRSEAGKAGVGDKIFEFLLIPRVPGKLSLPALEFGFFDPIQKRYYTKSTQPIDVNVSEPAPGSALVSRSTPGAAVVGTPQASTPKEDLRYLKPPLAAGSEAALRKAWHYLYLATILGLVSLVLFILRDLTLKGRAAASATQATRARARSKSWDKLRASAKAAMSGSSWAEVTQTYELLTGTIFDALDRSYQIGARSLPRSELRELLVAQRGLAEPIWERAARILEYGEMVRFATTAGAVSESKARAELGRWVDEGEALVRSLERVKGRK